MTQISRRDFLKTSSLAAFTYAFMGHGIKPTEIYAQENGVHWFKGQLHTHSQWSDGHGMPESVCAIYKENGYDFLCLSDHNGFQSEELKFSGFGFKNEPTDRALFEGETSTWKAVNPKGGWAQMLPADLKQAQEQFGADFVQTKEIEGVTYVRLRPFSELQAQFDEPGRFLLIPGFEQTGGSKDGNQVHMNFVNVTDSFPYIQKETATDTVRETFDAGRKLYESNPEPYLFTLNHPAWPYYDISPKTLTELDNVRFFELTNNPVTGGPFVENAWTPEKYWDAVNAFRTVNQKPILYATGSDDAHSIDPNDLLLGPIFGWNMVRAQELSTRAIMEAMSAGDFYVSTGLTLRDVQFCSETRTLRVSVCTENMEPAQRDSLKIEFIGTKKNFKQNSELVTSPNGKRQIDAYGDDIGVVLKTVSGSEGEYTCQSDDLYVRARVTVGESAIVRKQYQILVPCAWTQAYVN